MTPAERLHDEAVLHRVALSRYSNTTVRRVLAQLNRTEESVLERLSRADNEGLQAARLENLLIEIRALQANGWAVVRADLNGDLAALAMAEAEFAAKAVRFGADAAGLQLTTNVPVTAQVVAAVNSRPFQGRLLREWLADAEEGALYIAKFSDVADHFLHQNRGYRKRVSFVAARFGDDGVR